MDLTDLLGDLIEDMMDWASWPDLWAMAAAWSSSIRLRRHSSSYILISVIRLAQASSQLMPRLSFRTEFRSRPYKV